MKNITIWTSRWILLTRSSKTRVKLKNRSHQADKWWKVWWIVAIVTVARLCTWQLLSTIKWRQRRCCTWAQTRTLKTHMARDQLTTAMSNLWGASLKSRWQALSPQAQCRNCPLWMKRQKVCILASRARSTERCPRRWTDLYWGLAHTHLLRKIRCIHWSQKT